MSGEPSGPNARMNIDQIKKNLAKRTFSVRFDLENTDYEPLENIGIGAYGVVCSAIHKKTNDKVAIKKIPHIFDAETVTKRTYREIKILKHFQHDNIINIRDILKPKVECFQEIYVVFDLMESDLHRIIYTEQELTEEHIRYFLYQILRGLKYIHSANVIHRDLKPSNLLVNEDCHIRIGDFGMARGVSQLPDEPCYYMTQYVATRWYRAPEILLSLVEYGPAVDLWSVGCIFAEMLGRKHLFPGKNYLSQIKLIVGVLGSPPDDVLKFCQNDLIKRIIKSLGHKQPVSWKSLFPKASKKAIDLLSKMLTINPQERLSVEEALEHHYLSKYHDPDDEPICVPTFNFDFERKEMSKQELHDAIYKEIMEFHQPKTPTLSFNAVLRPAPKPEQCSQDEKDNTAADTLGLLQLMQENQQQASQEEQDIKDSQKEEGSFKKPMLHPPSDVSVNTTGLVPMQSGDIEMLSAYSTDGSVQLQTDSKPVQKLEDKQQSLKQQKQNMSSETKTISSDTKALVKQALLNASHWKQRSELNNEDTEGKPKVVTAAQRQKEREDKRKRKKEKANERLKKQKEKQNACEQSLLSTEDKELLKRWANMQTRIAPAVNKSHIQVSGTSPQSLAVSLQGTGLSLTPLLQTQTGVQTSQLQTIQMPSTIQTDQVQALPPPGQVQGVGVQHPTCISKVIQTNALSDQSSTVSKSDSKPDMLTSISSQPSSRHFVHVSRRGTSSSHTQQNCQTMSTSSTTLQQDTQNLSNRQQPYLQTNDPESNCLFQQGSIPSATGYKVPDISIPNPSSMSSQVHSFINTTQPCVVTQQNQVQFEGHNQITEVEFPRPETDLPISTMNANIPQSNTSESTYSVTAIDLEGLDFFKDIVQVGTVSPPTPLQHTFQFEPYPDQIHGSRTSPPKRHSLESSVSYEFKPRQNFSQDTVHYVQSQLSTITPTSKQHTFPNQPIPFSTYHQGNETNVQTTAFLAVKPASDSYSCGAEAVGASARSQRPENGIRHDPSLKITCNPMPSIQDQPDLIAMLSKQFSKSHVEDIFPPTLSVTPKGTGGGYGVGADLDLLMVDTQDHVEGSRIEQSPLSSSLLADWLDVRGNISIADLEALERELELHSPMAVSYSDTSAAMSDQMGT